MDFEHVNFFVLFCFLFCFHFCPDSNFQQVVAEVSEYTHRFVYSLGPDFDPLAPHDFHPTGNESLAATGSTSAESRVYSYPNDPNLGLVPVENGVKCLTCGKIVQTMKSARRHFALVHSTNKEDRKFICEICGQSFAVEGYKYDHIRHSHGITKAMLKNREMPIEFKDEYTNQ